MQILFHFFPKFADSTSPIVNNALYRIMSTLRNFVTPGSDEEKQLKSFIIYFLKNKLSV